MVTPCSAAETENISYVYIVKFNYYRQYITAHSNAELPLHDHLLKSGLILLTAPSTTIHSHSIAHLIIRPLLGLYMVATQHIEENDI